MERVVFLLEQTGERVSCLLNPEHLAFRRTAGFAARADATGIVTGYGLSDDPLIATGGGRTELDLDLLFDLEIAADLNPLQPAPTDATAADIAAPPPGPSDVRELTRPIWNFAENAASDTGYGAPPAIRFIWGRSWNILGVAVAVAERLERFTPEGMPQRSWMRLRLRRITDSAAGASVAPPVTPQFESAPPDTGMAGDGGSEVPVPVDRDGTPLLRLDQVAGDVYGDTSLWPALAAFNGIDNPLDLEEGVVLRAPPRSALA